MMLLADASSEVFGFQSNVKLSVPPTPAGTSRGEASLHAPKVHLSCRKAHLVEKPDCIAIGFFCGFGKKCRKNGGITTYSLTLPERLEPQGFGCLGARNKTPILLTDFVLGLVFILK